MKKLLILAAVCFVFIAPVRAELERKPIFTAATADGSVEAGFHKVTFVFGGSFAGTIGGVAFTSADIPLEVEASGYDTLGTIAFTVSAGTLRIIKIP